MSARSPLSPEVVGASLVPALRAAFRARLHAIQAETAQLGEETLRIEAALRALDGADGGARKRPSGTAMTSGRAERQRAARFERRAFSNVVAEAVGSDPGVRASVLALTLGRSSAEVRRVLEAMRDEGLVCRDGLGWRMATAGVSG